MPTPHFLQSPAWEKFQNELGRTTIRREGDGWSYLAIVEHSAGLTRLYCPFGPTVTSPASLEEAFVSLKQDAREHGAAYLRVQPTGVAINTTNSLQYGLRPISYSQPETTRVIDLAQSMDEIYAGISQSKRSICRNYQNKALAYHVSHDAADIELLLPLLYEVARRNHIGVHSDTYLRTQAASLMPEHASLHFMKLGDTIVAGALVFEGETTNYYAHAGNTSEHRNLAASTALVGELIRYSKDQGKRSLDLYGVAPNDDPNHPWAGVTQFKESFGGELVHNNQTYELPLARGRYWLYRFARAIRRKL